MCGICGMLNFDADQTVDGELVERMADTLSHRGPDDSGLFVDPEAGLGFRRLSIIDLKGGKQPIFNEDESAVIVFNGEIYNYRELAGNLASAGHVFKSKSDSETILHAYDQYGSDCVQHLRGMFAFAIWNRRQRRLLLARDRVGIKPLYYFQNERFFAFASEIKALLRIPGIPREVDPESFDQYLALRYVPGPRTMFKNIFRLPPGHTLEAGNGRIEIKKYWDVTYRDQSEESPQRQVEHFRYLLEESVRLRLISEVPLGVFLSGGIDSTAILALTAKFTAGGRVKTFSVGYEGAEEQGASNEFEYARLAADTFHSDHHECRLGPQEFANSVADLVWHLDEPLADPSCIPLHHVAKAAREHITVVLSGEGADEILAGYGIYGRMLRLDRLSKHLPPQLTTWLAPALYPENLRHYARTSALPAATRYRGVSRGFHPELMRSLIGEERTIQSAEALSSLFSRYHRTAAKASSLNRMLYIDTKVWLPDDLLLKADKMTMANSLELRVPFLDHRLIEYAANLPDASKLGKQGGKTLLRHAMRGVLPDAIIDRPKKGFPVPIASWLRTVLRTFTRDHLLDPGSACRQFVDTRTVTRLIDQHERGRRDRSQEIWTLLIFEYWHRHFIANTIERRCAA